MTSCAAAAVVLCPGHGVYIGERGCDPALGVNWIIAPFQAGEGAAFVQHVKRAVELAHEDPTATLVFSGGATKAETPTSEAQSYLTLAEHLGVLDAALRERTLLEEYARDSLENLAYTAALIQERAGPTPVPSPKMQVVGWEFKRARFMQHAEALNLDITYKGLGVCSDLESATAAEKRTLALFSEDPLGVYVMR
ncbi:hypothetical protein, variant [Salpingoeca rosetta]|uniref:DUF218 domain-containing protein n=1 Tax=Salpingoeca rosetta (strain ATCC 50818 / BSB-021) TaxID=946362 RepID=F2USD1_SALR5|nr:hypothetical protein, variant [Salpingoeca rosetta]EGD81039.1 hypothetical protein, variant [Salpingoeca rosetta]|eukprot:XP_004987909.1 hypothetical protein, variant [Salpingoeca rosetta]